jgi:hypothetical protein
LLKCLWNQRRISIRTKAMVYDSSVRSVLLYGCECWPLKKADIQKLTAFEFRCWRRIMRISYLDRISNSVVAERFLHTIPLEIVLRGRRLKWLGHLLRMPEGRIPRDCLLATPIAGWSRPRGGVKTTWKRVLLEDVRKLNGTNRYRPLYPDWKTNWLSYCKDMAANRHDWSRIVKDLCK